VILLTGTSDLITVVTGAAQNIDCHASWMDFNGSTVTPGRTNTIISSATTTTIVGSPASSVYRNVKTIDIRNRGSAVCQVTVKDTDGTNNVQLISVPLNANEHLCFSDTDGWQVYDANGALKTLTTQTIAQFPLTLTQNTLIAANTAVVIPKKFVIQSGNKLTIASAAKLRIV
jgi:hypothetical protein